MCSNSHSHDHGSEPKELDPELDESDESVDEGELASEAPLVNEPAPERIVELYGICIEYVERALGMTLDFTDETLPILEHYLEAARDDVNGRPELAQIIYGAMGAYFGELVRRRVNGFWVIPNPDFHNWRVCARSVFLSLNPIGVVREAIAQSDEQGGPSAEIRLAPEDRALVAERLALAPPVPEGQYYLLSTRLEAIDIVVETLRLAMQQGGHSGVEFEAEDYEALNY